MVKRLQTGKKKVENYYKVLDTRSNASPEKIKEKYIAKVKEFPPETNPEEFQTIRRAYEALRDPVRRGQYDLMRKYGGKLERMFDEAMELMEEEQWAKAAGVFIKILQVDSNNTQAWLGLGYIELLRGNLAGFMEKFQEVLELASPEQRPSLLGLKASLLLEAELAEEALAVLNQAQQLYPDRYHLYANLVNATYLELDRGLELWEQLSERIAALSETKLQDIHLMVSWINLLAELDLWSAKETIRQQVRKFIKGLPEEDWEVVVEIFCQEAEEYLEVGRFREAEFYTVLLQYCRIKNRKIEELAVRAGRLARLDKEIRKLGRDEEIIPLIHIYALQAFFVENMPDYMIAALIKGLSYEKMDEWSEMSEDIIWGLKLLKKKYPLVYKQYQKKWDGMLAKHLPRLNREARRRLR